MDKSLDKGLRAELRKLKRRVACILGVSVREVEMRIDDEDGEGEVYAVVNGENFYFDWFNA